MGMTVAAITQCSARSERLNRWIRAGTALACIAGR
jgi:hypothetical protein